MVEGVDQPGPALQVIILVRGVPSPMRALRPWVRWPVVRHLLEQMFVHIPLCDRFDE